MCVVGRRSSKESAVTVGDTASTDRLTTRDPWKVTKEGSYWKMGIAETLRPQQEIMVEACRREC